MLYKNARENTNDWFVLPRVQSRYYDCLKWLKQCCSTFFPPDRQCTIHLWAGSGQWSWSSTWKSHSRPHLVMQRGVGGSLTLQEKLGPSLWGCRGGDMTLLWSSCGGERKWGMAHPIRLRWWGYGLAAIQVWGVGIQPSTQVLGFGVWKFGRGEGGCINCHHSPQHQISWPMGSTVGWIRQHTWSRIY